MALDRKTVQLLRIRRRQARISRAWDQGVDFDIAFVFARDTGAPYPPAYISRHFQTLVTRHDLPRIRLHDLRHTSASLGLLGGESLLEASRGLGHSSIGITADVYAHVSPAQAAVSSQRLAELLDPHPGPPRPADPGALITPTTGRNITMNMPMNNKMMTTIATMARAVASCITATTTAVTKALRTAGRSVKDLWRSHEELMETSDLYRALVIALTAALARQASLHRLVLAEVSALLNAWSAARGHIRYTRMPQRYDHEIDNEIENGWNFA